MIETDKLICGECDAKLRISELLSAPHPFEPDQFINGCPKCHEVRCFTTCCDEPGCWEQDTIGTPAKWGSPEGYRRTCHKHAPKPPPLFKL